MRKAFDYARRTALAGAFVLAGAAGAQASDLSVANARLSLLPGATPGAGYFDIVNEGASPITLTGAESEAFEAVEMHESSEHDGMAHMHGVDSIEIGPGETFSFAPRGHHLMFMGRLAPLAEGDEVEVTLDIDGEPLPVTFEVVSPASL